MWSPFALGGDRCARSEQACFFLILFSNLSEGVPRGSIEDRARRQVPRGRCTRAMQPGGQIA